MRKNCIKIFTLLGLFGLSIFSAQTLSYGKNESTSFTNPLIWADMPDLSITRNGDVFYLISTTMHLMPGAPVMKSKDLVNWEMASYVVDKLVDTPKYDLLEGTVYGRGQWASSIRYHKGKYYVLFSPNDQPFKSYIFSTDNPDDNNWKLVSRTKHFHDASLFFDDDDRVFVFSGNRVTELKEDLSDVKEGGLDQQIFQRDDSETGLLEGNQIIKRNGKYYLMMISWPKDGNRRQVVYRADNIQGPYEKKVVMEDKFQDFYYVGQGALIDDYKGNWYALIFQDRGGVGRVPLLIPTTWENDWPILGNQGKVPLKGEIPLSTFTPKNKIIGSDDFSNSKLGLQWQWNHNPINEKWSLTDRKGYLRLKTNRVVENLYAAPNTLTQRMEGPKSSAIISLDVKGMKEGDVAGFSAFNGDSGLLSVVKEGKNKFIVFSTNEVVLEPKTKAIVEVKKIEKFRTPLKNNTVYFKIETDFNLGKDTAAFSYSLDNKSWKIVEQNYKMIFDYRRLFMGSKFAIYNFATKKEGGYVDVDFFDYKKEN